MINKIKDTSSVIHELHDARIPETGIIPSSMLPSYVDDVIEGYYYDSKFYKDVEYTQEMIGAPGIIYVDLITNKTYRWSGSAYIEISQGDNVSVQALLSSGEQIGTIAVNGVKTDLYIPTPFSGSWDDLEDKPFGETTTIISGDTLTWDGNTEGLETMESGGAKLYRISDAAITMETVSNGFTVKMVAGGQEESMTGTAADCVDNGGAIVIGSMFYCFPEDGFLWGGELSIPKKGVYLEGTAAEQLAGATLYLTIPGYTGFVSEQTVTTPLDEKYIPDTIARVEEVNNALAQKSQVQIITWEADD